MGRGISTRAVSDLRANLARHVVNGELPGLVALVSKGDDVHVEVVGAKSHGGVPLQRDSIFRISSMTKPVTAAAVMALVDDKKIDPAERLERLLPELADRSVLRRLEGPLTDTVKAERPLLVKDILTFTMGLGVVMAMPGTYPIQNAMEDMELGQGPPSPQVPPPPDEWMRRLGTIPLVYQPGDRWMYSLGSDLQGVLVARASGMPFEQFLSERIFGPLGMKDTGFSVPRKDIHRFGDCFRPNPAKGRDEPYDVAATGQWSKPPAFPSGAGGLVSTVDDFNAFSRMLLSLGRFEGKRVLSERSVKAMTTDHLTPDQKSKTAWPFPIFETRGWGYGLSVIIRQEGPHPPGAYGWDGGLGSSWYTDPATDLTTIMMTNKMLDSPAPPPVFTDFWNTASSA